MANHFHLPVSPVTLKTQTLRFPSLGGAGAGVGGVRTGVSQAQGRCGRSQDRCGWGSGQVWAESGRVWAGLRTGVLQVLWHRCCPL